MNCEHIETLLAAFVAGDLGQSELVEVREHVNACEGCRESLAAYNALESALTMRSSMVPPVDKFIPNIASGVTQTVAGGVAAYARARKWLDRMVSVPALATIGFLMSGLAAYFYRDKVATMFDRNLTAPPPSMTESLNSMMATWSSAFSDTIFLASVCAGVTIVALLSTGVATARLLRH